MTPTVANLKPAISLFLTNVSMPTQRRIRTCAIIARALGRITISAIKSHNGRFARKCDTLALHARTLAARRPPRLASFARSRQPNCHSLLARVHKLRVPARARDTTGEDGLG